MSAAERPKLAWAAIIAGAVLAGCGSKTDANATNFGAAIERHLEAGERLCLGTDRWPVELAANEVATDTHGRPWSRGVQMRALQDAGLVSASAIEVDEGAPIGKTTGRMRQLEFGEYKTARVIYTYRIVDVADWAMRSEMQKVFRTIESELKQAGREDVKALQLTSEGWEVQRRRF